MKILKIRAFSTIISVPLYDIRMKNKYNSLLRKLVTPSGKPVAPGLMCFKSIFTLPHSYINSVNTISWIWYDILLTLQGDNLRGSYKRDV